jgi:hypothetical protein
VDSVAVRLFDAGAGATGVVTLYTQTMTNGEKYRGLTAWTCKAN